MSFLSSIELFTVHSKSHFTLYSKLKNNNSKYIGEIAVSVVDHNNIKNAKKCLDPVTIKTLESFEVQYDGYIFDKCINPYEQVPFVIWGRIAVLDNLYIYPEFRTKGHGKKALQLLIKTLHEVYRVDFLILKPYPLFGNLDDTIIECIPTKKIISQEIKSLTTFYEKIGFKTQKNNKDYYQCLYLLDHLYCNAK